MRRCFRYLSPLLDRRVLEQYVQAGNIAGVLELLVNRSWAEGSGDWLTDLQRTIENRYKQDPDAAIDELFESMIAFTHGLILRLQIFVGDVLDREDNKASTRPAVPEEVAHEWLPRLAKLHQHAALLAEARTRIKRLGRLARKERRCGRRQARGPRLVNPSAAGTSHEPAGAPAAVAAPA